MSDEMKEFREKLIQAVSPERDKEAQNLWELLRREGKVRCLPHVEYRCRAEKCLLLGAYDINGEVLIHQREYKYSPAKNEACSNAAGRAKHTTDNNRHWRGHTYWIGTSALDRSWTSGGEAVPTVTVFIDEDGKSHHGSTLSGMNLTCDHLDSTLLTADRFWNDWERRTTGNSCILIP